MKLLMNCLRRRVTAPGQAAAQSATRADGAPPADERPPGCGWFDSSLDLQQGLWVHEHLSVDALARELPLSAWLELHLATSPTPKPTPTPALQ